LLNRIQYKIGYIIGANLHSKRDSLSHWHNVASLSLLYKYFHGHCSEDLASLVLPLGRFSRHSRFSTGSLPFTLQLPVSWKKFHEQLLPKNIQTLELSASLSFSKLLQLQFNSNSKPCLQISFLLNLFPIYISSCPQSGHLDLVSSDSI